MPSSKLNKYCRIFQWIEKHDPELAECIKDLCLEGALSPYRGINGITFLMPAKGSPIREKIVKYTYSSKAGEDADAAVKLIESLIITDNIPDIKVAELLTKNGQPIGNKLRIKQVITKITSPDTVVLNNGGCTIKSVNDFNVLSKRNPNQETNRYNISIWKIFDGQPATEGEKFEIPRVEKKSSKTKPISKTGKGKGREKIGAAETLTRKDLNEILTNKHIEDLQSKKTIDHDSYYLRFVYYLLTNIKNTSIFEKIKSIIDYDPIITFYILVQPYCSTNSYLLSDNIMKNILNDDKIGAVLNSKSVSIKTYHSEFFNKTNESAKRADFVADVKTGDILKKIIEIYEEQYLDTSNIDNGIINLFIDQFRFLSRDYLNNIICTLTSADRVNEFKKFIYFIKNIMPGNDMQHEIISNNNKLICGLLDVRKEKVRISKKFIKSGDFLYKLNPLPIESIYGGNEIDEIVNMLNNVEGGTIKKDNINNTDDNTNNYKDTDDDRSDDDSSDD